MARIRPQVNPNQDIPNDPFYSPETTYFRGPYYPAIVDATSNITVGPDGVITVTGGGGAVSGIFAGTGISVSGNTGNVTITNTGVTDITAGTGITLSANTGSITISASGGTGTVTAVNSGTGLTGGPITTSGTLSLANTAVAPGPYTLASITVDAQGRLTSAADGSAVTSITAGTGLSGGTITGTGTISLNNTGAVAGPYTYPSLTVDPQGRITTISNGVAPVTSVAVTAPAVNLGSAVAPNVSVQTATTGQLGAVQVGTNINVAAGVISVDTSSTTQSGIVQLNNTLASTSTTEALTAAQGKVLQDQIASLSASSNLTLAGTFDASTSQMLSVTASGTTAGFTVGSNLPAPAAGLTDYFVIVTTAGSYSPPGGGGPYTVNQGDWFLCDGTVWQFLNVGTDLPIASTGTAGIVELADTAETQTGTDTTRAVTPAGAAATYVPISDFTAKGDILSATAANTQVALPVGADGTVLTACAAAATGLCWSPASTPAIPCACITSKGALVSGSAVSTPVALAPGNEGDILVVCNAATSGLCWTAPATTPSATPTVEGIVFGCTNTNNTALGSNAFLGGVGSFNVAIGTCAMCSNPSSSYNIAIGHRTAKDLTSGQQNTLVGYRSAELITTGSGNVTLGIQSLINLTLGSNNVAIGPNTGLSIITGSQNVVIGPNVNLTTTCSCSLALGFAAGCHWLTGDSNKNIRPGAGIIDCTGSTGTAGELLSSTGSEIEWLSSTDLRATPTTYGTLQGCTGFAGSTALGFCALAPWSSSNSAAIGSWAMCAHTGNFNVALGAYSLQNGSGDCNVAVGYTAARFNSTGKCNTFVGSLAGQRVTTGGGNVGIGYAALYGNSGTSTGIGNVSIGNRSGCSITAGSNNITIGNCAGCRITSGNFNTIVGSQAAGNQTTGNGLTAIGYNTTYPSLNVANQVFIMHPTRAAYFTTGSWSFVSDRRAKDDITALPVDGETFINSLRPVQYTPLNEETKEPVNGGETHVGFIAQEVDDALKQAGMEYVDNLVGRPEDPEKQHYSLSTDVLVPFLVKAVQELSAKVAALEGKSNG